MPATRNRAVRTWLFMFSALIAFLVLFGGFVRLTRSGLSIAEWNPVGGTIPPLGEEAWQEEFLKYQATPEFQLVNPTMTLQEYQYIFWIEWMHRLLARLAGLAYALPLLYFVWRRTIPIREFGAYALIGLGFIGQAFAGWYMVASGLQDRPAVSHLRLTLHLLIALSLLALSLWLALGHQHGFGPRHLRWGLISFSAAAFVVLVVQISYGGLTAGLKAGFFSDTWPLMFGQWIPDNLLPSAGAAILSPPTVVFIHRWLALAGLLVVLLLYFYARRMQVTRGLRRALGWIAVLSIIQVLLGVIVVLTHVQISFALLHQANAVLLFAASIVFLHRASAPPAVRPGP